MLINIFPRVTINQYEEPMLPLETSEAQTALDMQSLFAINYFVPKTSTRDIIFLVEVLFIPANIFIGS